MLELIVLCSGALVMILEMVGSRALAPHLGTSIVVWTSLIGVVLAFLAVGGWAGGRLADRHPTRRGLAAILAAAGASTLLTAALHGEVGAAVAAAVPDQRLAAVASAVGLLALPALFCGMVTPYVIRLRLVSLNTSGRTVGRLYALSTAGSIAGTFLGGFVLISWFGTTRILFGVAAALLGLALVARPRGFRQLAWLGLAWLVGAGAVMARSQPWIGAWPGMRLIETSYSTLAIMEGTIATAFPANRRMRFLSTDPGGCQSAMYLDGRRELALDYTKFYQLGPALRPDAQRALMLGGGGYSVPRWLLGGAEGPAEFPAFRPRMDVVELDPGVTGVARKFFGVPDTPRLSVIHEDARVFLNRNRATYDLVFVDLFNSSYAIPFHVATVEAMAGLRRAVAPGGVALVNLIGGIDGDAGRLFAALHGAIRVHFPETHVFAVRDPADRTRSQNIMILAFPEPRPDLARLWTGEPVPAGFAAARPFLAHRVEPSGRTDVPPLTDAYAPVERYMLPLARESS